MDRDERDIGESQTYNRGRFQTSRWNIATSVEEIEKKKNQVEIPPTRRGYFTIPEFWKIRSLLPDYELELINGEITVNKRSPLPFISIADFKKWRKNFPIIESN